MLMEMIADTMGPGLLPSCFDGRANNLAVELIKWYMNCSSYGVSTSDAMSDRGIDGSMMFAAS